MAGKLPCLTWVHVLPTFCSLPQAIEREGALDKLRTKQFAADKLFLQQVRSSECKGGSNGGRLAAHGSVVEKEAGTAVGCCAPHAGPLCQPPAHCCWAGGAPSC